MPVAQRLLERRVQLLGADFALLEVQLHQLFVDFDHLLDQRAVCVGHRREIRLARRIEKAIDDFLAAAGRQIDRQAFLAERALQVCEQTGQIDVLGVDLVDDDHAAQPAFARPLHHALGHHLDAVLRVDDHHGGLDRGQRVERLAEKIRIAGRVDQVDVRVAVGEVDDRAGERVLVLFFERSRSRTPWCPCRRCRAPESAPALYSSASASVVLPAAPWPTRAMVRIASVAYFGIANLL